MRINKLKLTAKGWGPWKYEWYSICSAHHSREEKCSMCQAGYWVNCWIHYIDSLIYKYFKSFWLYWHNRENSKTKKQLRKIFPKLK